MANGRIPKDMCGELVTGTRTSASPLQKYVQTQHESGGNRHYDMGGVADDRGHYRSVVKTGMRRGE